MMMADYLDRGAAIAPDAPCMVAHDGTVLMTHADFNAVSHRVAAALAREGLRAGERVAVYSPNDAHAFACVAGVIRAGGVWTALNAANTPGDLAEFLNTAGCSRLLYHGSLADKADAVIRSVRTVDTVVSIGHGRTGDPELSTWLAPEGSVAPAVPADASRVMMMLPTGGTTGKSKAVPVSHRQFLLMCLAFNAHLVEDEPPRYICAAPMTHAAGGAAFPVLAEGAASSSTRG